MSPDASGPAAEATSPEDTSLAPEDDSEAADYKVVKVFYGTDRKAARVQAPDGAQGGYAGWYSLTVLSAATTVILTLVAFRYARRPTMLVLGGSGGSVLCRSQGSRGSFPAERGVRLRARIQRHVRRGRPPNGPIGPRSEIRRGPDLFQLALPGRRASILRRRNERRLGRAASEGVFGRDRRTLGRGGRPPDRPQHGQPGVDVGSGWNRLLTTGEDAHVPRGGAHRARHRRGGLPPRHRPGDRAHRRPGHALRFVERRGLEALQDDPRLPPGGRFGRSVGGYPRRGHDSWAHLRQ